MPPANFPRGCRPIFTQNLTEAVQKARRLTSKGLLLILSDLEVPYAVYRQKWFSKKWLYKEELDITKESPYTHLLKDGILAVNPVTVQGFEWPTIIVDNKAYTEKTDESMHDCNYFMRCTTNLIIVDQKANELSSKNERIRHWTSN